MNLSKRYNLIFLTNIHRVYIALNNRESAPLSNISIAQTHQNLSKKKILLFKWAFKASSTAPTRDEEGKNAYYADKKIMPLSIEREIIVMASEEKLKERKHNSSIFSSAACRSAEGKKVKTSHSQRLSHLITF